MVVIIHLALAVTLVVFDLWIFLFIVTITHWIAPWLKDLCIETQHAGLLSDRPDYRMGCRTVILGPVMRFLYWHMNYHVEHHMYASVPFYNLGKLRKAIEFDLPEAPRGLWRAWRQMLPILYRQRKDPEYVFVPALPETAGPSPEPVVFSG